MRRMRLVVVLTASAVIVGLGGWGYAQQKKTPAPLSTDDYVEIQRLLYTNHTGYDLAQRDNGDMWTNTFLPDAVLDNPPSHLVGHKEIRAYATDPYKTDPKRMLRHWTSTFHVSPHPEGAILSAFYTTMISVKGGPMTWGGSTGRYESLVVKTKDGWRFKHHVVISEGPVVPARGPLPRATP